jgi:hypothetical protein
MVRGPRVCPSVADRSGPAHSPCSRVHTRPAGGVTAAAGGLLPHRFTPHPHPPEFQEAPAGLLSVAVVVGGGSHRHRPHLPFRGAPLPRPMGGAESREVPLRSLISSPAADRLFPSARSPQLYQQSAHSASTRSRREARAPVCPTTLSVGPAPLPSRWARCPPQQQQTARPAAVLLWHSQASSWTKRPCML